MNQDKGSHSAPRKKSRTPIVVILVLVIIVCLAGAGYGIMHMVQVSQQVEDAKSSEYAVPSTPDTLPSNAAEPNLPDNPVNFEELRQRNEDIYAWLYVPNTNVNYPVLRHPSDNAFYLDHDENKAENAVGAIYSEDYNTTDFKDGVTVLYGHNINDGQMFNTLHYFEDEQFFLDNSTFYIYAPGHVFTYRIVSAFVTDDQHVLWRYDYFQTFEALRKFEAEIQDPHSLTQNVRKVDLDDSSKIVVLSTCNSGALEDTSRYLVCGVMTDDQPTA